MHSFTAVLTAAGSGSRLGCDLPKALIELEGQTLLWRAASGLASAGAKIIVVTAPENEIARFQAQFPDGRCAEAVVVVVKGGPSRQASVAAGLSELAKLGENSAGKQSTSGEEFSLMDGLENIYDLPVLVHDAARALTPPRMIARVVQALVQGAQAVIPALPVSDTIKEVTTGSSNGLERVCGTPPRANLRAVQTPQGFQWETLLAAHRMGAERAANEDSAASDDATLVEELGVEVLVVLGDERALKITRRPDLALAAMMIN